MLQNDHNALVKLNVGGKYFVTSYQTLTWIPDTFFTSLLSGRIPTLKDETGAIFIDRDPDLFNVILNYMRSKNVDVRHVDLLSLKHEAQFYGILPLVRRLTLCSRLEHSSCGDVLFHGYFPPLSVPVNETNGSDWRSGSLNGYLSQSPPGHHRNLSEPIAFISCGKAPGGAIPATGPSLASNSSNESSLHAWALNQKSNNRNSLTNAKLRNHRISHSGDYSKVFTEDVNSCRTRDNGNAFGVRCIRGHQNWIAIAYSYHVVCYCLEGNVGWSRRFTSPRTESCIRHIAVSSKTFADNAEKLIGVVLENNHIVLWSISSGLVSREIGRFSATAPVHGLFFISSQMVALSKVGKLVFWHGMTKNWQVQDTARICCYDTAGSMLLLGCSNGCIYYIDMQKFPLRIKDNDLLVVELHRDPLGDAITAINVYLTPKSVIWGKWLEIAYGTSSGIVRIIAQHPETASQTPQLFQTFTVHRSPVIRVALTTAHLISVCAEYNHVRSWTLTRFRGMINTQPGSTPLASFKVMTLEADGTADADSSVDVGPFGDKDSEQIFVQKVVPDTSYLYVRLASTGERICVVRAVDGVNITCFLVQELECCSGMGTTRRRFLFTGHANGSVQMWDLTTALNIMNSRKEKSDYDKCTQGPTCDELLQMINECEITYQLVSFTPACTPYDSTQCLSGHNESCIKAEQDHRAAPAPVDVDKLFCINRIIIQQSDKATQRAIIMPPEIYFEKQEGMLCAQHALNNLLQAAYFNAVDLAEIARRLDQEERAVMITEAGESSDNMDDTGFFSVQVISEALKVFSLSLVPVSQASIQSIVSDPSIPNAFVCHLEKHWFAIRRIGNVWYNLNSMLSGPTMLSSSYLQLFLTQLCTEGCHVFLVEGLLPPCPADNIQPTSNSVGVLGATESAGRAETDKWEEEQVRLATEASLKETYDDIELEEALRASRLAAENQDALLQKVLLQSMADLDTPGTSGTSGSITVPDKSDVASQKAIPTAEEIRKRREEFLKRIEGKKQKKDRPE